MSLNGLSRMGYIPPPFPPPLPSLPLAYESPEDEAEMMDSVTPCNAERYAEILSAIGVPLGRSKVRFVRQRPQPTPSSLPVSQLRVPMPAVKQTSPLKR